VTAENFDPEYIKINRNGTIPSLTSASLSEPLIESTDILRYLDTLRGPSTLTPDAADATKAAAIMDLVHSDAVSTNIILLRARDPAEMTDKKASVWREFVANRQARLEKERDADPSHPFYAPKAVENGAVHQLYAADVGDAHKAFYDESHALYKGFADGMAKLEPMLTLPYAVGDRVTEADFHIVPWLSHALWGAGTEPSEVQNFATLEALIQKSVPGFKVGPRTREWWANIAATDAFKKVFPVLH
jgi:glutathione S-transferase